MPHSLQRQLKVIREEIDRDFTMRNATAAALRSLQPDLATGVIRYGAALLAA